MGQKYEKLMASMQAELDGTKPEETTTTTTEDTVVDTPPVEDSADDKPAEDRDTPPVDDKPADDRPVDDKPTDDKPTDDKPAEHRDIPDDPVKRAEFAFRRQLNKNKEKYERELKERDDKYEKLMKEVEELKKASKPEEPMKTRADFEDDEEFIKYLLETGMKQGFAKRDEEEAKRAAERAEAEKKKAAEEQEIRETQAAWLRNVGEAFGDDKARANKFLGDIQYANEHGLGEILDNCPVASDYLMHDPMGPLVFDKVIHDKDTFNRVFDMRRLTPMNIFYQLKKVEEELANPAPAVTDPAPAPAKPPMPHLGKPGRQAAGSSMTNNDMFSDPKAVKRWLREQRR